MKEWPRDSEGNVIMDTLPLDLQSLLSEMNKDESKNAIPFPKGGGIGHIHLRVTNLERSIRFYHEKLGLDLTVDWRSMGAAFLSKGGYHHHVGINTWYSLDGEARKYWAQNGQIEFSVCMAFRSILISSRKVQTFG